MRGGVTRSQNRRMVLAGFTNGDFIAGLYGERRDIDLAGIDLNMAVAHHLTSLSAAGSKPHAVDHTVQAPFEQREQVFTGDALHVRRFLEVVAELRFEQTVDALGFLFFAKLQTVADDLGLTIFPMLT